MGKYFKYAIGEILLVVVGILIALQINNWNEERKFNLQEASLLKDLLSDLVFTKDMIENVAERNTIIMDHYKKIIHYFDNDLPYDKNLDPAFELLDNWASPYLPNTAYETIKTKGLDIIKNDSLKKHIIKIYEYQLPLFVEDYDRAEWNFNQSVTLPLATKFVHRDGNSFFTESNDFETLKTNREFKNFLITLIDFRNGGIELSSRTTDEISKLIEHINIELTARE